MYLGIDVGGSKTLLAVFGQDGRPIDEHRFPTSPKFDDFISDFDSAIKGELKDHHIVAACCAVPAEINRKNGVALRFGNLPWRDVPIQRDLQKALPHASVFIENDAKLGGLSEALAVKDKYRNVLYLTLGTGIGVGHIVDGLIDTQLSDRGGDGFVLEHNGQLMDWEDFASGKALYKQYGQKASAIDDPKIWRSYASDVAKGLEHFIEALQAEIVIIGGGVGVHFDKYGDFLRQALAELRDFDKVPPIIKAKKPSEAVIYGCFDYCRQQLEGKS